jgi:hypothetical protein
MSTKSGERTSFIRAARLRTPARRSEGERSAEQRVRRGVAEVGALCVLTGGKFGHCKTLVICIGNRLRKSAHLPFYP